MWKRLLFVFFGLVLVDGAIRKWVFPAQTDIVYLVKDGVLLLACLMYMARRSGENMRAGEPAWIRSLIAAYAGWAVLEVLNPNVPSFALGAFGIKSHVLYLLVAVMTQAITIESAQLERWAQRYLMVATVIAALGVVQFFLPPTHLLNRYAVDISIDQIATAGLAGRPRITGSFSYITGMTTFCLFNIGLGTGLLVTGLRFGGRVLSLGMLLLLNAAIVAPMTGSRAAVYLPMILIPFVLVEVVRRRAVNLRFIALLLVASTVLVATRGSRLTQGWTSFAERVATANDADERTSEWMLGPLRQAQLAGLFGYGTGSTHQAAARFVPDGPAYSWLPTVRFEEENGRVALELGVIGLVLFLLVKLRICQIAYQVTKRAKSSVELSLGIAALIYCVAHIPLGIVYNPVASAAYWALAGQVIRLRGRQRVRAIAGVQRRVASLQSDDAGLTLRGA